MAAATCQEGSAWRSWGHWQMIHLLSCHMENPGGFQHRGTTEREPDFSTSMIVGKRVFFVWRNDCFLGKISLWQFFLCRLWMFFFCWRCWGPNPEAVLNMHLARKKSIPAWRSLGRVRPYPCRHSKALSFWQKLCEEVPARWAPDPVITGVNSLL